MPGSKVKPFTPFQWEGQTGIDEFHRRIYLVKDEIKDDKIKFNYHDPRLSYMEGVIARGDRRISKLILRAFEKGCKFDGWTEHFEYETWLEAMDEVGIDGEFYANRVREEDEVFPWDFIDIGVTKEYLREEYNRAMDGETTKDCRKGCNNCGISDCVMRGVYS